MRKTIKRSKTENIDRGLGNLLAVGTGINRLAAFLMLLTLFAGVTFVRGVETTLADVPEVSEFNYWVDDYLGTTDPTAQRSIVSRGVAMAGTRRARLLRLIKSNPELAIRASVSAAARRGLPAAVLAQMETPVSGIGDFNVLAATSKPRGSSAETVYRVVRFEGQTYRAYTYGRRLLDSTKHGIPLSGIALDGIMAVRPEAITLLKPSDPVDPASPVIDLQTPAESARGESVLAEMGGVLLRFGSLTAVQAAEARVQAGEKVAGPNPSIRAMQAVRSGGPGAVAASVATPWTTGSKKVLIIRVDFSDFQGSPVAASQAQAMANNEIAPFYRQNSYGTTTLTTTVTPQVYRMPKTGRYYAGAGANDELHDAARAAAAAGYQVDSYDRVGVLFPSLGGVFGSQITYGGLGQISGPHFWLNGFFDMELVAHELGHTYGVGHANLWQVRDGSPVSQSGFRSEYDDEFDVMGSGDSRGDFNPWFKNLLGWLPDSRVLTVTRNGVYRVYRFDTTAGTLPPGTLALKIERDSSSNYWIGVRRKFTDNGDMQSGAYVIWGYNTGIDSDLLDTSTPGVNTRDAALGPNETLRDPINGITIKSVAGTALYEDVQVTFSESFAPIITSPSTADGLVGASFSYQITARGGATSFGVSGTLPPGLSLNTVTGIVSGKPTTAGNYAVTVRASNAAGTGTKSVNFAIVSSKGLGNAVESPTLLWTSQGTTVWKPESLFSSDGSDSVRSGAIPDNGISTLITTVTGPATVIFRWKIDSEANYDFLKFRMEGAGARSETSISGQWSWTKRTFTLGARNTNYTLSWTYSKDGAASHGYDAGWVDGVVVYGPGYPVSMPDFDVDGRTDLFLYSASTRRTAEWYLRDGARIASTAWGPIVPAGYEIKGTGDFNGDGETDLVLYRAATRQTAVWLLKEGRFVKGIWGPLIPVGWQIAAVADMNRDNKPDLVLYRAASYQTAIWLMNGASYSSSFYGPTLVSGYQLAGVADFNRDKYLDFVLYRSSDRRTAIWYLDSSGSRRISSAWGPGIPAGYRLEGVSDFDRSGRPDFLLYSPSTRRTAVWYLNNTSVSRTVYGPVSASGYALVAP